MFKNSYVGYLLRSHAAAQTATWQAGQKKKNNMSHILAPRVFLKKPLSSLTAICTHYFLTQVNLDFLRSVPPKAGNGEEAVKGWESMRACVFVAMCEQA